LPVSAQKVWEKQNILLWLYGQMYNMWTIYCTCTNLAAAPKKLLKNDQRSCCEIGKIEATNCPPSKILGKVLGSPKHTT